MLGRGYILCYYWYKQFDNLLTTRTKWSYYYPGVDNELPMFPFHVILLGSIVFYFGAMLNIDVLEIKLNGTFLYGAVLNQVCQIVF